MTIRPETHRRSRATLVVLCVLAAVAGCSSSEDRGQRALDDARDALERGDLETARRALEPLQGLRAKSADALLERCALLARAGEAPQAIWQLEEGLVRFPARDDLRIQLATTAFVVGNPVLARGAVSPIDRFSPQHLDALLIRARAALELGDLERALTVLAEAESLYPEDPKAVTTRILTLVREQRLDEAAAALEAARGSGAFEGEETWLDVMAASVESANGEPEAAARRLRARLAERPDDLALLQALTTTLSSSRQHEEAVSLLEAARSRTPERSEILALLAGAYAGAGRLEDAEAALRDHAALSESPSAQLVLSQYYVHLEQPERALATLQAAVERFPESAMLRMHLAEASIGLADDATVRRRIGDFRELSPGDPHGDYLNARLALSGGDAEWCIRLLRPLMPRLDRAYTQYWLGRALEASGDLDGAERRYGLASLRDPANPAPTIARLRLAEARGDWTALAVHALTLVQRAPWRPEGYATAITALVRQGETARAVELARLYAARLPEAVDAPALLAFALRSDGALDEAGAVLDAVPDDPPPTPAIENERALLAASRGDLAGALALVDAALVATPDATRLHHTRTALLFAARQDDAGAAAVERALALDPDEPEPLEIRARYYAATGRHADALADADRYLEKRPRDAEMHFIRGTLLSALEDPEAALASYERAIELDERQAAARNNMALLLENLGRGDEALAAAQEAYALSDSDPAVIDTLAWLYWRRGLADRAVALLERAHALVPEHASIRLHLALAYRDAGRADDSRALLDALIADAPGTRVGDQAHAALRTLDQ